MKGESRAYDLMGLLGQGAYGSVYKAKYRKTGQMIAVKMIELDDYDQGISSTTLRQITILKKLKHPNIIQLYDYSIRSDLLEPHVQLIFQYMDEDLNKHKKKLKKYEPKVIKNIMRQIVSGLSYMHSLKVMHRDLKPHNILINSQLEVKIADFGLARIVGDRLGTMSKEIETLWYRSPQLLLGSKNYGYAVDIWSLGCIFYELAEGKVLFQDQSQLGQIIQIMKFCGTPHITQWMEILNLPDYKASFPKFLPTDHFYKNLNEDGSDLLERMIKINPEKRISMEDIVNHPYFDEK